MNAVRPARPDEKRLVYLGLLTKPQGIRGAIRLLPEFDDADDFENLKTDRFFLKPSPNATGLAARAGAKTTDWKEITLSEFQTHQRFLLFHIDGIDSIDAAEPLRNHEVYVYEEELWDLPEGKYYGFQLEGLELFDLTTVQVAGKVKELRPGYQDFLVIKAEAGEFLVPYVPDIVKKVSLTEGRIEAELPEGIAEI